MKAIHSRSAIWQKLSAFSRERGFFCGGEKVLAAVSGGPDSVCLLHFLAKFSRSAGFEVFVCHVNHGLRRAASADGRFVEKLCESLGVRCATLKADVRGLAKKRGLSLEHAARSARYSALSKAARRLGCSKIALGHQLDDHVETILLNLLRGTKLKGLLGIPSSRPLGELTIMRPILCLTRAEVAEYLKLHHLSFRLDETNKSEKFTRNWIRLKLLKMLEKKQPRFKEHLLAVSEELAGVI